VHDVTIRFCELYVDWFSRTWDQMVQAARSGVLNIAEGIRSKDEWATKDQTKEAMARQWFQCTIANFVGLGLSSFEEEPD